MIFKYPLIVMVCMLAMSIVSPRTHAQFQAELQAESPNRGFIRQQLELEVLEKQLDKLLQTDEGTESEKYDELMEAITEGRHRLLSLQQALEGEQQEAMADEQRARAGMQQQKARMLEKIRQGQEQPLQEALKSQQQEHIESVQKIRALETALRTAHEELERQRERGPEKLDTVELRIYRLAHVDGRVIEERLMELMHDLPIKIAVGPSSQSLIVRADKDTHEKVEALIQGMDQPAEESQESAAELPSVLVRLLLLTEGNVSSNATPAMEILPESVIGGLEQIGIENPHVALLSTSTVALERSERTHFQIEQPGNILDESFGLEAQGQIAFVQNGKLRLELQTSLNKRSNIPGRESQYYREGEMSGSMILPLGHYMVLGTGNYVSGTVTISEVASAPIAYVVQVIEAESYDSTTPEQRK